MRTTFAILAIITFGHSALAQELVERNATREEIVGTWEIAALPETAQPKYLKNNPWPAECQWFSFTSSGGLKSFDKTRGPCETKQGAELKALFDAVPSVSSWQYDLSPSFQKALVIVRRTDAKDYIEYWEPHYVTKSFKVGDAEVKEGDLLFYLVNMQAKKIVWIRHLQKVH